jgi:CRP-like cAMP-binding protein
MSISESSTQADAETSVGHVSSAVLGGFGLFGGIDEATLSLLAREVTTMAARANDLVVREGDLGSEMFAIVRGRLQVRKRSPQGSDVVIAVLGPGDCFGEMEILDVQPRCASVLAIEESLLVRLSADQVERLLYRGAPKAFTLLVMNMAREMSRRLRLADALIAGYADEPPPGIAPQRPAVRIAASSAAAARPGITGTDITPGGADDAGGAPRGPSALRG